MARKSSSSLKEGSHRPVREDVSGQASQPQRSKDLLDSFIIHDGDRSKFFLSFSISAIHEVGGWRRSSMNAKRRINSSSLEGIADNARC
eukprot:208971-Hanusia_phi.AAC.1